MSKEMGIIVLGLWITISPYLGVPSSWRTVFMIVVGLAIVILGFLLRMESLAQRGKRSEHRPFAENNPADRMDARTDTPDSPAEYQNHDRKEGLTSLN